MTLESLCRTFTVIREDGFSVNLETAVHEWDAAIRAAGRRRAYREMAGILNRLYGERYGRPFLFSDRCMAFEIQFHADAYLAVTVGGYPRHVSTLLFSREALLLHCREIDISEEDVKSLRQRLMFGYRRGVRPCYRGTERDPFSRLLKKAGT